MKVEEPEILLLPDKFPVLNFNEKAVDWPIVYLLNKSNKHIYVGETTDVKKRFKDHESKKKEYDFDRATLIYSPQFNKSVIYDLEGKLIKCIAADRSYNNMVNIKLNQTSHSYFQKEMYNDLYFKEIWNQLKENNIVQNDLSVIENMTYYKYSPFTSFSYEQMNVINNIIEKVTHPISKYTKTYFSEKIEQRNFNESSRLSLVNGAPGTGKTLVAIKLISDLINIYKVNPDDLALCISQPTVLKSMKRLVKELKLPTSIIIKPVDIHKRKYKFMIIDESHRLKKWHNKGSNALNHLVIDKENKVYTTELTQAIENVDNLVLLYDAKQSIRPGDVDFNDVLRNVDKDIYNLRTQFRVQGGNDYLEFIETILQFGDIKTKTMLKKDSYDFKIFDNLQDLQDAIKQKEEEVGLSRMGSGYYVPWISKKDKTKYDFEKEGLKAKWNVNADDWVHSKTAIDEVGCIYTLQGHDLNYAGIIIGDDLKYDKQNDTMYSDPKNSYDKNAIPVKGTDNDNKIFLEKVKSTYYTLLTRGIHGTYIYVKDDALREYIEGFIE